VPTKINDLPVHPADPASQLVHRRAERNPTRHKSREIFGPAPLGAGLFIRLSLLLFPQTVKWLAESA
jgi:hypothetical protein